MSVLDKLINMAHPNLYYSRKGNHEHVDQYLAEQQKTVSPGFTTTVKTRPLVIAKLEELIRNGAIKIKSNRLYNELKTFVWYNGKAQAMRGYNDDLVMACAIASWIRETALTINKQEVAYKRAMLNCLFKTKKSISTTIDGMKQHNRNKYIKPDPRDIVMNIDKPFFRK